jgi:uncharacterized membrane protein
MQTRRLRILMMASCGGLCVLILTPAFLAASSCSVPAILGYLLFSPLCHQIPERSFHICGYPLAVCHRCSGIYFGLFLGLLLPLKRLFQICYPPHLRLFVLCICTPIVLDFILSYLGIWPGTPLSRFSTGLIFGSASALLLTFAAGEFPAEYHWQKFFPHWAQAKGVIL